MQNFKHVVFVLSILFVQHHVLPQELFTIPQDVESRWISFENPTGAKGRGGMENKGAKGHAMDHIKAGESKVLFDVKGSGIIHRMWITIDDKSPKMLRSLKIEMFWDGADKPAVTAPFGDFFMQSIIKVIPVLLILLVACQSTKPELMKLSSWDRGITIESPTNDSCFAHLWFYEWHLFDAILAGEHTHGSYNWEWTVSLDETKAEMSSESLKFELNTTEDGANMKLEITNNSEHDWPEIAAIIPCFNPGHKNVVKVNPLFLDEEHGNTYFLGEKGLELIKGDAPRELHFNQKMLPAIMDWEKESKDGNFVFASKKYNYKWPVSERNAQAGLMIRESKIDNMVMGIAWNSYISVQGHNPWHCMHLSVRVGPLKQGETKTIHGKIYLFEGEKEDCLKKYKKDFLSSNKFYK